MVGRTIRTGIGLALVAAVALFVGRLLVDVAGSSPIISRFAESERGGCPSTPNCVSSLATDPAVSIEPIDCFGTEAAALAAFGDAIEDLPRVERLSANAWVVYSRVLEFPSDVRASVSPDGIEVISSSRLGSGDFGANRNRIELLRPTVEADPRCN